MADSPYLIDSNVLLRLIKYDDINYPLVRGAIDKLLDQGVELAYTMQNMAEFWNVSTRPQERNGFGLTIEQTEANAQDIEQNFIFLPDTLAVYREWRRIVVQHRVSGVRVHDARLAAVMYAYGLTHLLTLNQPDFVRYSKLRVVHPSQVQP